VIAGNILLTTKTNILYVNNNILFFNTSEREVCAPITEIISPDFNYQDIGLEDIDTQRIISLDIEGLKWYKI
jgi:hypothetical protein